jgi:type I restriction enzyme, S subunit
MKSSYKRLGNYIHKVENRNRNLKVSKLVGLSMTKEFRESTSNVVGTDMSVYKIVNKWQFACDFMSVIRVHKFPVVLKTDDDSVLVSPAYTVFEVNEENELNPEYLMMWFRRSEFDRYADFKCDSAIRGGFDWDALCDCMLPIPSIEKQREIVKEYKVIQNRIALNNQLIAKLEETAQTIYKQWFVDFEFPNEKGLPYKSNGGKMVWCGELEKEIPEGWEQGTLENLYKFQYGLGNTNPNNNGQYPIYGAGGVIGGFDKFNSEDAPVIGHMGAYCGAVVFAFGKHFVTYNGVICMVKCKNQKWFSYLTLQSKDLMSNTRGSSQPFISYDMLYEIQIILPIEKLANEYDYIANKLFKSINLSLLENQRLEELKDLLLAKMTRVESEVETVGS